MKTISNLFLILAVLLSDVMCAVVAYNYCEDVYKRQGLTSRRMR